MKKRSRNSHSSKGSKKRRSGRIGVTRICQCCGLSRKKNAFPKGCFHSLATCLMCVVENIVTRDCTRCGTSKGKDEFSSCQWSLSLNSLNCRDRTLMTTAELQEHVQGNSTSQLCLDCVKTEELTKKKALAIVKRQHNLRFYDFENPVPAVEYSFVNTADLVGTYDILFHFGVCSDEFFESRTTKGTAKLEMVDDGDGPVLSGQVRFLDALRLSEAISFQRDFDLSGDVNKGFSSSAIYSMLTDAEAQGLVHLDDEPAEASIRQIESRAALRLVKYEQPEDDDEVNDKAQFCTLEEAEALAESHKRGTDHSTSWLATHCSFPSTAAQLVHEFISRKPDPVFFLEPGDLILKTYWSDDFRDGNDFTECLLRKRAD